MELNSKQRAQLRALANTMEPILQIGKDGIGDNLIKQAFDALEARELVKATVLKNAPYETQEACNMLCEAIGAAPVQCIGQRFVMYKPSRKHPKIELV